jgi:hypothetical protein
VRGALAAEELRLHPGRALLRRHAGHRRGRPRAGGDTQAPGLRRRRGAAPRRAGAARTAAPPARRAWPRPPPRPTWLSAARPGVFGLQDADYEWVRRRQTPHPGHTYEAPLAFDPARVARVPPSSTAPSRRWPPSTPSARACATPASGTAPGCRAAASSSWPPGTTHAQRARRHDAPAAGAGLNLPAGGFQRCCTNRQPVLKYPP